MSSTRKTLGALAVALALASGCTIQRAYLGNEVRELPEGSAVVGQTTKREILELLGPPDKIQRQYEGDVFVYAYVRRNSSSLTIEEPVITNLTIFSYQKSQEKSDRMVVLFDRGGVLVGFGFRRGTDQLETF
jgi:outer membrane protein assembly factor BamE (lipoprotein component of BamABCDE complex)